MNKTLYLIFTCFLLCAGTRLAAQTFDYGIKYSVGRIQQRVYNTGKSER